MINITHNGKPIQIDGQESIAKNKFRVLLVYPNLPLMLVPPLAIGLFTRILKDYGYEVELFDTTSYIAEENSSPSNRVKYLQARKFDYKHDLGVAIKDNLLGDFREKVLEYKPHAMIASVVEDAFPKMIRMLKCVKDLNVPHIVGGVFPTAAPEKCIEFDEVNMIGQGEGEKTIIDFTEAVRLGLSMTNILGTWNKDESGKIHKNPQNGLIDIDISKPDFSLFDGERFFRPMGGRIFKTIPVESYRGCPYKCTFCNSPMQVSFSKNTGQGGFLRRKSMPVLRDELKELIDIYNPEFLYFIDDSFLARPPKEVEDFCEMYREFSLPFWFNTRPEACEPHILKWLKEIGCYRVSFGIECGNEQFRKKILKRYVSNDKLVKHFNIIAESGIAFSANLIIGFPGETRSLIMETVDLVRRIYGYDTITVSMFTPYNGTELRKVAVNNGWLDDDAITIHTTSQSMLSMPEPYVSKEDLDGLMRVVPLYCYFPKSEWPELKIAETNDDEGNMVLKHYSEIYNDKFLKESQDDNKDYITIDGATGCKSNPKDSFRISTSRLSAADIEMLTVKSY